jgi:PKD repeat protein
MTYGRSLLVGLLFLLVGASAYAACPSFVTPAPTMTAGDPSSSPIAIAKGDFNGDGKVDFAVANSSENELAIMRGFGDGTFNRLFKVTATPAVDIVAGDFDGDGKLDLVTSDEGSPGHIYLYRGDSSSFGGFADATSFPSVAGAFGLAVGDFNGDGKLDVAVAGLFANAVAIHLGNGAGGLTLSGTYPTLPDAFAVGVATADFNGDGKLDLVVTDFSTSDVELFPGNGDGTFGTATILPLVGAGSTPQSIVAADFNGDGKPDFAVANRLSNDVDVFLNNGTGSFTGTSYAVGNSPGGIAVADLTGDGKLDIAVGDFGSGDVSVLVNSGGGAFQAAVAFAGINQARPVSAADMNGDGKIDLLVGNGLDDNRVTILINNSSACTPVPPSALAGGPYTANLDESVSFADGGSTPAAGDSIASYSWAIDGAVVVTGSAPTVSIAQVNTLGAGSHTVVLTVTAVSGLTGTASTTLTIYDNRPMPAFTATPNPAVCSQGVALDASTSTHGRPDRSVVAYSWDFGDGSSPATGVTANHTYARNGQYTVTLTVTDNNAPPKTAIVTALLNVVISNHAPTASAGGPYVTDLDVPMALNGTGSSDDDLGCGDVLSYSWAIDGTPIANGASPTLTTQQLTALGTGSHNVVLTVTDLANAANTASTTLTLYDNHPMPAFTITPNPATCSQTVAFDASTSTHGRPDRSIAGYSWDFGDGSQAETGVSANHVFTHAGVFTVTLGVFDNNVPPRAVSVTHQVTVNIVNHSPAASAGGAYVTDLDVPITLNGSGSSDADLGCGDVLSYSWAIDGTPIANGASPTLTTQQLTALGAGSHNVVLTVTDLANATNTASTTLTIYDNHPMPAFTITPNPATCSQTVAFDASTSTHGRPDRSIAGYSWDFGDGSQAETGVSANHVFTHAGVFTVSLGVFDNNVPPRAASVTHQVTVNIVNHSPVASAGGAYVTDLDVPISLNGSGSSDADLGCGDVLSYSWAIDGTPIANGASPALTTQQLTALGTGSHNVVLTVTDLANATNTASTTLTIYDNHPMPAFTITPNPATCSQTVAFDASTSTHGRPDRSIAGYSWDFGDGSQAETGVSANHVFTHAGVFTVSLGVFDNNVPPRAASVTHQVTVNIVNHSPVASAGGAYVTDLDVPITLNGSGSTDADLGCGDVLSYSWAIDGTPIANGASPALTTQQLTALGTGSHNVVLTVTDLANATNTATTTLTIYDNHPMPAFTITPNPATCSQTVAFDASTSTHGRPDRSVVGYSWDFGDGIPPPTGASANHVFTHAGVFTVTLGVFDNNLPPRVASVTHQLTVNIVNHSPAANAGGPYTVQLGSGITLSGSASTDPDTGCGDSIASYSWTVAGSINLTGVSPTLTAQQVASLGAGTFPVALTVTDSFAASSTASTTITVAANSDVTITKTHTGNFARSQIGATYTLIVTNSGNGPTSAPVSVTDNLPAGLSATAINGSGWNCTLGSLTCTRSDQLLAGASYPAITLTVNVSLTAAASVTNTATVSGGGETNTSNDTASDLTTIRRVVSADFNGDGASDLLWRNASTGTTSVWLMDAASVLPVGSGITNLQFVNNGYTSAGTGDFNGDGKADIIWRDRNSGETFVWMMNGQNAVVGSGQLAFVPPPWQIVGVGDFNGDGKSDLLWRNMITGDNSIWLMNGVGVLPGSGLTTPVADLNWGVKGIGDFNGDGKSDILWRNDSIGLTSMWMMNGTGIIDGGQTFLQIGNAWRVAGVGDFNGDGYSDVLWRNITTGDNIVWLQNGVNTIGGSGVTSRVSDTAWSVVGIGDFNSDGKSDILWRNDTTGATSIWMMDGAVVGAGSGTLANIPAPWQIVAPSP